MEQMNQDDLREELRGEEAQQRALVPRVTEKELSRWRSKYALQYQELMGYYRCAAEKAAAALRASGEELALDYGEDPIEGLTSEYRTPESILDGILAKGLALTVENMEQNTPDLATVRVRCPFASDLYHIAEALSRREELEVTQREDAVEKTLEDGWRGLRLLVTVPVRLRSRRRLLRVTVLLQTGAMALWDETRRMLLQKRDVFLPEEITREMRECASLGAEWDQRLEQIRYNVEHRVITK